MRISVLIRNSKQLMALLLVAGFMFTAAYTTQAQTRPIVPMLSLMGEIDGYDRQIYPDGRIVIPPSEDNPREFLVPVFIENRWETFNERYVVPPITSFKFSVFYNEEVLQILGVETVHPSYINAFRDPLASNFAIDVEDQEDDDYWLYLNPNKDIKDRELGRRATITGISGSKALPHTDLLSPEFEILLYLRFRIDARVKINQPNFELKSPLYFDTDEVKFNDFNAATQPGWQGMIDYDTDTYLTDYPTPSRVVDGLDNRPVDLGGPMPSDEKWIVEPTKYGTITVVVTDNIPEFRFSNLGDDPLQCLNEANDACNIWEMRNIVSVDENANPGQGLDILQISNGVSNTRLNYIEFETDQPWLLMRDANIPNTKRVTFFDAEGNRASDGRKGAINYIDNGRLGVADGDPVGQGTEPDDPCFIQIVCDPEQLPDSEEPTGLHVGYITFRSPFAKVSPVRVKVNFLYIKNPDEPVDTKDYPGGITINLYNNGGQGQQTSVVFGTGNRASEGVDELYGEFAYQTDFAPNTIDARFFPINPDLQNDIPFGFGDKAPNRLNPRTNSRDIRSSMTDDNSYTYLVRFNPGPSGSYPIVLEWNVNDFPVGATAYLLDTLNGQFFEAVDMIGDRSQTVRTLTIRDASVRSFLIEYTLPTSLKFVDANGDPIIKRGWNLLSLPLNPSNKIWDNIYKRAINVPWHFKQGQYQQREELKVGEGYFVKYPSSTVDTSFAGSFINRITKSLNSITVFEGDAEDPEDPNVRGGWNLVGALSVPTSIDGIQFEQYEGEPLPSTDYTLEYGVYTYKTDRGYFEVATLDPGLGYWIKVSSNGFYNLQRTYSQSRANIAAMNKDEIKRNSNKLVVRDNSQKETKLYFSNVEDASSFELPPVPPAELFDVRFDDNKVLANTDVSVIKMQGTQYPVSFNMVNADADYTFIDPVTEEVYGTINAGETKNLEFDVLPFDAVKVLRKEVVAGEEFGFKVYPNPINSTANVNFNVEADNYVNVAVYDELGNQVLTLVDGFMNKGQYVREINAENLTSGNYILRIRTGSDNAVIKLNVVK